MRRILPCSLLAAILLTGCEAPQRTSVVEPHATPSAPSTRIIPQSEMATEAFPIPDGLPRGGSDVYTANGKHAEGEWVEGVFPVVRILRDDTKPPRHQRFVIDPGAGWTILIAHNIDVAPRVPLNRGDTIAFRGQYIWSQQGGTVHWTHRDKRDRSAGGWIVWKGQNFR